MKSNHEFVSDQWWIDYMEGECEPGLQDGLELLLRRSDKEQKKLAKYEGLRNLIKEADDVYLPENGNYYAEQRRNVMRAIMQSERPNIKSAAQPRKVDGLTINVGAMPLMLIHKSNN